MNGKQYNIKRDAWNADLHDAFTTVLKVRLGKKLTHTLSERYLIYNFYLPTLIIHSQLFLPKSQLSNLFFLTNNIILKISA